MENLTNYFQQLEYFKRQRFEYMTILERIGYRDGSAYDAQTEYDQFSAVQAKLQQNFIKLSTNDLPLVIGIVGSFNTGKSSLINSLLGSEFLVMADKSATRKITTLTYKDGNTFRIFQYNNDDNVREINYEEYVRTGAHQHKGALASENADDISHFEVGKSSFINSVFGVPKAETASDEACTKIVEFFAYHAEFGEVCLIDTPGLAEADEGLDYKYLNDIKRAIRDRSIDYYIFITPLNDTRFRPIEAETIRRISQKLGNHIWNSCWMIFSFAGSVPRKDFEAVAALKTQQFNDCIREVTHGEFQGFNRLYFLDNVVNGWHEETVPVKDVFND